MYTLKKAWKETKHSSFRYRIRCLCRALRYSFQRFWRGYDDMEVYDLGFSFYERMVDLLRAFRKYNCALFNDPNNHGESYTEEEINAIIDKMIFYFENCDFDTVLRRLYGKIDNEFSMEKYVAVDKETRYYREKAMKLFSEWCDALWY